MICVTAVTLLFAEEVSVSFKSVLQACQERVSYKSVKYECRRISVK